MDFSLIKPKPNHTKTNTNLQKLHNVCRIKSKPVI